MSKYNNIVKRYDDFSVEIIENGFILSLGGRDNENKLIDTKVYCSNEEVLFKTISEFVGIPRQDFNIQY